MSNLNLKNLSNSGINYNEWIKNNKRSTNKNNTNNQKVILSIQTGTDNNKKTKEFGVVSSNAYYAISNNLLDYYEPVDDEEKKVLAEYKLYTGKTLMSNIENKVFGRVTNEAYKAIQEGTIEKYNPVNKEEKQTIDNYLNYSKSVKKANEEKVKTEFNNQPSVKKLVDKYGIDAYNFTYNDLAKMQSKFPNMDINPGDLDTAPTVTPKKDGLFGIFGKSLATKEEREDAEALLALAKNNANKNLAETDSGAFVAGVMSAADTALDAVTLGTNKYLSNWKDSKEKEELNKIGVDEKYHSSYSTAFDKTKVEHPVASTVGTLTGLGIALASPVGKGAITKVGKSAINTAQTYSNILKAGKALGATKGAVRTAKLARTLPTIMAMYAPAALTYNRYQAKLSDADYAEFSKVQKEYSKNPMGKGNIDLTQRPIYRNEDGTISTVSSMTITEDNKAVLIPTIVYGADGVPTLLTESEAIAYYEETGEHLGKFNSIEEADEYAKKLSKEQGIYYKNITDDTKDNPIEWLDKQIASGNAQYTKQLTASLDFILPTEVIGKYDLIGKVNDYYGDALNSLSSDAQKSSANLGKGWETVGEAVQVVTAALPNSITALFLAGANVPGQATQFTKNETINAIANYLKQTGKNPQYWTSLLQTIGSDYEEAKKLGASKTVATFSAIMSSAINAGIELGGIQGLPDKLINQLSGDLSKRTIRNVLVQWATSMLEEGYEEVLQGIVSNSTARMLYNHNAPFYSTTDDKAIINPVNALKEFSLGAVAGGFLGGGQVAAIEIIDRENTSRIGNYMQDIKDEVIAVGMASPQGSASNKLAQKLDAKNKKGGKVSDYELGKLHLINLDQVNMEELIENISVGDKFKDTSTGNTITVVNRDSDKISVEIETDKGVNTKEFVDENFAKSIMSGQVEQIASGNAQSTSTETETIEDTSVVEPVSTEQTETVEQRNIFTGELDEIANTKMPTVSVGDNFIDKDTNNILSVVGRDETTTTIKLMKPGGETKIYQRPNNRADSLAVEDRYVKVETSAPSTPVAPVKEATPTKAETPVKSETKVESDVAPQSKYPSVKVGDVYKANGTDKTYTITDRNHTHTTFTITDGNGKTTTRESTNTVADINFNRVGEEGFTKVNGSNDVTTTETANNPFAKAIKDAGVTDAELDADFENELGIAQKHDGVNSKYKTFNEWVEKDGAKSVASVILNGLGTEPDTKSPVYKFVNSLEKSFPDSEDMHDAFVEYISRKAEKKPTAEKSSGTQETESSKESAEDNAKKTSDKKDVAKDATTTETEESIFIDDRTWEDAGNRKVKAFQYENPQVKPFYKAIAQELLSDIKNTTKGERMQIGTYETGTEWTGTKRHTSDAIARIKDVTGASYDKITDALNRIINDSGQENVALAKKIELVIDDMLSDGYTSFDGQSIPADEEYLALKSELSGEEYISETNEDGDYSWLFDDERLSLSSMGASFFGNEKITADEFEKMLEDGSYKEHQGYKDYLKNIMKVYTQSHNVKGSPINYRAEIERQIEGIIKVGIAAKRAGYDIFDDGKKRSKIDSKKRLLFSSLEPNSDYVTSSDVSTICDKAKNFTEIHDAIIKLEEARGVPNDQRFFKNIDNYFVLHKLLSDKGLTIPCDECYVQSMRKNLTPMADAFIKLVQEEDANNKSNEQLYHQDGKDKGNVKKNNADMREKVRAICESDECPIKLENITVGMLTTADGLATLRCQAPLLYEAFNSFYGQSKPKMPREASPLRPGELIAMFTNAKGEIKTSLINKIKATGGFRLQSYSDFQIENFVDVLQTIFEASMLGLNGHAYTKVPAFLEATKGTNLKRNISIFMYEDEGQWMLDKKNSFPMELEDIYALVASDESGNTSIIAVSQNENMSAWIMANDNVGYGIPFHKSGTRMEIVRGRIVKTPDGREVLGYINQKDHTKQQTEVWKTTVSEKKKINTKVSKPIDIYKFWDFENKGNLSKKELIEKNLKAYIDKCNKANYRPKFREYVMNNESILEDILSYSKEMGYVPQDATIDDISFEYDEYRIPYGYYKFLGDFGMFTPDGKAVPIEPLSLENYDFEAAENFFADKKKLKINELLQQFENGPVREEYRAMVNKGELTIEQLDDILKKKREAVATSVVDGTYADDEERLSISAKNTELSKESDTALYIKNTKNANYIDMIFNGEKTEETRSARTLDAFVGKNFYVTDGKYVYGSIVLGKPHKYTETDFHNPENQKKHRVPKGDEYDIKQGGIKWSYPIESYEKFDKPKKLSDSKEYKNSFQARQIIYDDNKPRITTDTTDGERTKILSKKSVIAPIYEGQADKLIKNNSDDLNSGKIGFIKKAIIAISEEFGVVGSNIKIEDVGVKITLSKSNLKESISKEITPTEIAKLMPVLTDAVSNAIGVERHDNRYYHDTTTMYFDNLLGGYIDGENFVPVRFGLKHSKTGEATLYVIVDQNVIPIELLDEIKKTEVVNATASKKKTSASRSVEYSVSQIVSFVKSKDLLRYIPDDMLDNEQKSIKWQGIAETIVKTNEKNDKHYADYIRQGNLSAANRMVKETAKAHGYSIRAYHGTPTYGFTKFDRSRIGSNSGVGRGVFSFTTNKESAEAYSGKNADSNYGDSNNLISGINKLLRKYDSPALNSLISYGETDEVQEWDADIVFDNAYEGDFIDFGYDTDDFDSYDEYNKAMHQAQYEGYVRYLNSIFREYQADAKGKFGDFFDEVFDVINTTEQAQSGVYSVFLRTKGNKVKEYSATKENYNDVAWKAIEDDNDVSIINLDYGEQVYFVKNPEDIKSADIVTYDDDGNIIPLSERFNIENDDMRWSMSKIASTTESEVNNNEQRNGRRSNALGNNGRWEHNGNTRKQVGRFSTFEQKNKGKTRAERKSFAKELLEQGQTEEVIEKTARRTYKYNLVKTEAYNDDMKALVEEARKHGIELGFFVGEGRIAYDSNKSLLINGIKTGKGKILVQYDHNVAPQKIFKHECGHFKWKTAEMQNVKETILSGLTEAEKENILATDRYQDYLDFYKGNKERVWEEFVVDTLSGMNEYTERFIDTVNNYWYGNESAEGYTPSTYAESIDAGGTQSFVENIGFGDENKLSVDSQIENIDDEYMEAYYDGDDEKAQELVEIAAKRAGYTYRAYHRTERGFTVFDLSKARKSMDYQGFYFSADANAEREYGSVLYDTFLKMNNPYIIDSKEKQDAVPFDLSKPNSGITAREWLQDNGYDSVIRKAEYFGAEADEYIVFDSTQIKSAEPYTYTDDENGEGDIIPLSERFNEEEDDIRLSIVDEDTALVTPETLKEMEEQFAKDKFKNIKPTFKEAFGERAEWIAHNMTRVFPEIPERGEKGVFFAEFRKMMVQWNALPETAQFMVQDRLTKMTKDLNPKEFDTFGKLVYYLDLQEEAQIQKRKGYDKITLPHGRTVAEIDAMVKKLKTEATENVNKALAKRQAMWDSMTKEYIKLNQYVGFDTSDMFNRKHYYHNQVQNETYSLNPKRAKKDKDVEVNDDRDWLKERQVSEEATNTDFLAVEYKAMLQMQYDIYVANILGKIKDKYDIKPQLEKQAFDHNKELLKAKIEEEAKEGKTETSEQEQMYNQKILNGYNGLIELAELGKIPAFKGQFDDIIKALKNHNLNVPGLYNYVTRLASMELPNNASDARRQAVISARTVMKYTSQKKAWLKELLGYDYQTWETLANKMKATHSIHQPRRGNYFYTKDVVNEDAFSKAFNDMVLGLVAGENGVDTTADVKKLFEQYSDTVRLMGAAYEQWVIPVEIETTMNNVANPKDINFANQLSRTILSTWKGWSTSINPLRTVKFGVRNMFGDLDAVIAGNPKVLRHSKQAVEEIFQAMKNKKYTPEFMEWVERGGYSSLLFANEMDTKMQEKVFKHLFEHTKDEKSLVKLGKDALTIPAKLWEGYYNGVETAHNFREAILRYSAYLYFKNEINKNGGVVKDNVASNRYIIQGLDSVEDKAYQLSKDLLGAYDEVATMGQALRRHAIPFYSFTETNLKRYYRMFENIIMSDDKISKKAGKLMLKTLMVNLLPLLMVAWNKLVMGDDDDKLPTQTRNVPHITLGNGYAFRQLGSFSELLEWFGLEDYQWTKEDVLAPVDKVAGMITPLVKTPTELITGLNFYPSITQPRAIRDRWEHFFNSLGVADVYKELTGKPTRGISDMVSGAFIYHYDEKESAYYEILDVKRKYQGDEDGSIYKPTDKSNAIYYMKTAIRYKDKKAALKYLEKYFENGGTAKGITQSIAMLNPMYGYTSEDTLEKGEAFVKSLSDDERAKLRIAINYYEQDLMLPENVSAQLRRKDITEQQAKNLLKNYINSKCR